jgi:hypothetical protein
MTDNVMLLVALVSFAVLVLGWMILPDATHEATEAVAPVIPRAVRAA